MRSTAFRRLRAVAAKSPITLVRQVPTSFAGALIVLIAALLVAETSIQSASAQTVTYAGSGAVNLGTANVCPVGKTTPSPCSQTLTLTYNVTESGTLGTPKALTTGAPDLDYKATSGTTCSGSVTKGNTCKVNVTFAPTLPGQRNGAVEIVDTTGNVLATTYISGIGVGPLVGFAPQALRTIFTFPSSSYGTGKVVVDGKGNLFFVDSGASVGEMIAVNGSVPVNPVVKYLPNRPCYYSDAIAIDGAGNLFIGGCTSSSRTVVELLAASDYTTSRTIGSLVSSNLDSIVVDGSGNVFILQGYLQYDFAVQEFLAANDYATVRTLGGGFKFDFPTDMALDVNGNLFVTDLYLPDGPYEGAVEELSAASGYNTVKIITVDNDPLSIAIDAANNLLIGFGGEYGKFLAVDGVVPSNPTALYFYIDTSANNLGTFSSDAHGNIYCSNTYYAPGNPVYGAILQELPAATGPALGFAPTEVGHISTDSPQTVQIQNQGNAALDLSGLSLEGSSWELVKGSGTPEDCTSSTSLTSSGLCNINISFKPTEATQLSGTVTLTDNSLNVPDSPQSITLSGTGVIPYITSLSDTYGAPYSVVILNGINFGSTQGSSTVTFNGVPTPHYHWSDTKIYVTVPPNATTGNVVVNVDGQASNPVLFHVGPQPTITGIYPTSGPAGTVVGINGTNLYGGDSLKITYNGETPTVYSYSSTVWYAQVPADAVTGHFHVVVNDTGMNSPTFTVTK